MDLLSTAILAGSLIIIMFGMGLSLVKADFTRIFVQPRAIITGLLCQLILLPATGFLLIYLMDLPAEIAIGLIVLAACPGGPTSNLITYLARGDLALSVSLTAISSMFTLISIPFIINLGLKTVLGEGTLIKLDIASTILQIFVIVIIPVLMGMLVRSRNTAFADRMLRPVRIASAVVFVLVLVGIILKERTNILPYYRQAGLSTLYLNIITMGFGFMLGKILALPIRQRISIAIEGGIQNGTLAITIATVLLSNTSYAIAPAVYSITMFLTAFLVIFWGNRKRSKPPSGSISQTKAET